MAKPTASEIQRSLASIEALCNYARAAVRLKMGDSAKLYRAEDDLSAAILSLSNLRSSVGGARTDSKAEAISALGEAAADRYMRGAKRTS